MYAAERQQRILDVARRDGRVEVSALADDLAVAAETIRRDLSALERRGGLRRVHGGAIPVERLEVEPSLAVKVGRLSDVKRRIAARALDEIPEGGSILLDAGSTTQAIADLLPAETELTVVTNSLSVAATLSTRPAISLLMVGGRIRHTTGAAVGDWAMSALAAVTVDVAFLGTNGISARRGLTTPDQAEAATKRAMVSAARTTVVVTDSSKAGDDHLHRFAHLEELDVLITDTDLDEDLVDQFQNAGLRVVTA